MPEKHDSKYAILFFKQQKMRRKKGQENLPKARPFQVNGLEERTRIPGQHLIFLKKESDQLNASAEKHKPRFTGIAMTAKRRFS